MGNVSLTDRSSCWASGAVFMWFWIWLTPNSRGNTGAPHFFTGQLWPSSWLFGRIAETAPSQFCAPSEDLFITWKYTQTAAVRNHATFSVLFYFFCREKFWENLSTPLFGTLIPPSDTTEVLTVSSLCFLFTKLICLLRVVVCPQPCVLEACAFVMKIIGLEIYYVHRYIYTKINQFVSFGLETHILMFPLCGLSQQFPGAVSEGWTSEVLKRATLRVLVPVCQVPGVPCGRVRGGGHLLLLRDTNVDLCLADAADFVHQPRTLQSIQ